MRLPCCVIILFSLLHWAPANAELLGTFSASTNYLWRGVTQTNDKPAVAAGLEYQNPAGSYLGAWASNTRYGDKTAYELDLYLGRLFSLNSVTLDLGVRHYYFPYGGKYRYDFDPLARENKDSNAFSEIQLGITRNGWDARATYSNNYLDSGYDGSYIELNYTQRLDEAFSLTLHLGTQHSRAIDDEPEKQVGDYSATLLWRDLFLTWSNLTDNADGRQSERGRVVLGWSRMIPL